MILESGQPAPYCVQGLEALAEAPHRLTVPFQVAVPQVFQLEVCYPPERRALELGADLFLAIIRSDQEEPHGGRAGCAQRQIEQAHDPGVESWFSQLS